MKAVYFLATAAIVALSFNTSAASTFRLNSTDIPANLKLTQKQVFKGFGCSGDNISPQLSWQNPPVDAKSFAITLFDPDAPTGSGWWHWTVVNIPAQIHILLAGPAWISYPLEQFRDAMISVMLDSVAPVHRRAINLIAISLPCGR